MMNLRFAFTLFGITMDFIIVTLVVDIERATIGDGLTQPIMRTAEMYAITSQLVIPVETKFTKEGFVPHQVSTVICNQITYL